MTKAKTGQEARIFAVETRFQKLARRDGGVPRDKAIAQAHAEIEQVKPDFDQWFDIELRELAALVNNAQSGEGKPGWIETAGFRSRQLRDSAGTLGFELIEFIAGSLCEILESIEAGNECNMESILCHVDALILARQPYYRALQPEQVPELTKGLRRVVKHVTINPLGVEK